MPPKVSRPHPAPLARSTAIARLRDEVTAAADPAAVVERFWASLGETPLVEPIARSPGERVVTFLWRDADAVEVLLFANRLTDERRIADSLLHRVPDTDVWHLSYRMAADWRASYSFLVRRAGERAPWRTDDDQVALRAALDRGRSDPRNPETCTNRAGVTQSVVALPRAPVQRWLARRPDVPRGRVRRRSGPGGRRLWVYQPPDSTDADPLPVVVVLDGEVWSGPQTLPVTMDNLLADAAALPARLVFVDSGGARQRWRELDAAGDGAAWIARALVPWLRERYAVPSGAGNVVVAGQSLGGYTALRVALEHPDVVGVVLAQSASTWQGDLGALAGAADRRGLRAYLEVGRQEWVLLEPHRELARRLASAGADVSYVEFDGGHDYACWRGGIAEGLRALLPPSARDGD